MGECRTKSSPHKPQLSHGHPNSSLDLASDYLTAKARADKSTDLTSQNYSKKRGIASEYKQFKEQKAEVDRWESMQEERVSVWL